MTRPAAQRSERRVIVIGGDANGLAAATRLARSGRKVTLLVAAESLGGQGRSIEFAPGFQAAPLALDPGWVPPEVNSLLRSNELQPTSLPCPTGVVVDGGTTLSLSRDPRQAAAAIARFSPRDSERWPAFVTLLHRLSGFLGELYRRPAPDVDIDPQSLRDLLPLLSLGRRFRGLGRRDMVEFLRVLPLSVWELADDWFESAPLKAAIAAAGVFEIQQGPRSGGTGLVLLHHLVGAPLGSLRGRMPWRSGPDAFTRAAQAAAASAGVTIRTGYAVEQIVVEDEAVVAVRLVGGERIETDAVLSSANPVQTILDWVDPVWLDPEFVDALLKVRHRGCTAFVLYALDALPKVAGLEEQAALSGILSLTGSVVALERAADAAKYGTVAAAPHIELHAPTLLWPEMAPSGKQVLIARVQYAPYRRRDGAAWDESAKQALAAQVDKAIEAVAPGFGSRVLARSVLSPLDLERQFGLREGAGTHGELALDQILFMRPVAGSARHRAPLAGLYFGGFGAHPGPGVLGGAGWLAAQALIRGR